MKNFFSEKKLLLLILLFAAGFRFFGLNWDQNQHLHPDERFLTMVGSAIKIPDTISQYLNPKISPINPYNAGYNFFVYGAFPLNITKIFAEAINFSGYMKIHFVGRFLSALFDLGVVFLLYKIGKKNYNGKIGLLSAFLYSVMVLPIQLSHFFAVDTFMNFFMVLSFYLLTLLIFDFSFLTSIYLGISFGLALACKISVIYFSPIIAFGFLFSFLKSKKRRKVLFFILYSCIFLLTSLTVFRLAQPQTFSSGNFLNWKINPQFIGNIKELSLYSSSNSWYPPSIQWQKTTPIIFPLKNLIFWGMGLPLGIVAIFSLIYRVFSLLSCYLVHRKLNKLFSTPTFLIILIIVWILGFFFYQGTQFIKTMRYFLPIYPFLTIIAGKFLDDVHVFIKKRGPKNFLIFYFLFFILLLIYPFSFLSIYAKPTTRVSASEWIYKNIPAWSVLANEHWDDSLPLSLPGQSSAIFPQETLEIYNPDTIKKWEKIENQLKKTNYIILSSNRLYGSIPRVPEKYPQASLYYQSLFDGSLGFEKVAEFASYPCFPPIGKAIFCLNDDSSEEAFTVYDHPKVIIFKNNSLN